MIKILQKGEKDLQNAFKWYKKQSIKAADSFVENINTNFKKIAKNPTHYMYVNATVQRCNLIKYPYKIFFAIEGKQIVILRIRHKKQKPLKRFK